MRKRRSLAEIAFWGFSLLSAVFILGMAGHAATQNMRSAIIFFAGISIGVGAQSLCWMWNRRRKRP
jgi:hypothetical protein